MYLASFGAIADCRFRLVQLQIADSSWHLVSQKAAGVYRVLHDLSNLAPGA
jgi:hypothetical protein